MKGLARFLAQHDLTQTQVARAVGITPAAVSLFLSTTKRPSKRTIDRMLAYCRTVDPRVTYDELFGEEAA